jgi:hypothetical protein
MTAVTAARHTTIADRVAPLLARLRGHDAPVRDASSVSPSWGLPLADGYRMSACRSCGEVAGMSGQHCRFCGERFA